MKELLDRVGKAVKSAVQHGHEVKRRVRTALVALRAHPAAASRSADPLPSEIVTGPISRMPGLTCPRCQHRIQITMSLLLEGDVVCTGCFLHLSVDREHSKEALLALDTLHRRMEEARRMLP